MVTPIVDLVPALLAAGGPLLQLPTAQAGWRNYPNLSQQEVVTTQNGHPVASLDSMTIGSHRDDNTHPGNHELILDIASKTDGDVRTLPLYYHSPVLNLPEPIFSPMVRSS